MGRLRTSRSHSCVPLFIAIYDLHKRPSRLVLVGALIANLICLLNRVQQPQFDLCKHLKAISMRLTTTAKKSYFNELHLVGYKWGSAKNSISKFDGISQRLREFNIITIREMLNLGL